MKNIKNISTCFVLSVLCITRVDAKGDEDLSNNNYNTLFNSPCLNYLYQNSFETANGYWIPGGTNSTWAWGIVAKPKINKASDGTKVWITSLKGNYANSESSYLESPCFDFTSAEYPVFAFDYWINSENGVDGFRLDYSINGGTTQLISTRKFIPKIISPGFTS